MDSGTLRVRTSVNPSEKNCRAKSALEVIHRYIVTCSTQPISIIMRQNTTLSPAFKPIFSAEPAPSSRTNCTSRGGMKVSGYVSGEMPLEIAMISLFEAIQMISMANFMSFIQKLCLPCSGNMNSMPSSGARAGNPLNPRSRVEGCLATIACIVVSESLISIRSSSSCGKPDVDDTRCVVVASVEEAISSSTPFPINSSNVGTARVAMLVSAIYQRIPRLTMMTVMVEMILMCASILA